MNEFSVQQQAALDAIKQFLDKDDDIFILTGQAGSGKTALIPEIIKMYGKVKVLSATNQGLADLIFSHKLKSARTIYHEFYDFPERKVTYDQKQIQNITITFALKTTDDQDTIFVIDNAGLLPNINNEDAKLQYGSGKALDDIITATKIRERHNKLIFIGDDCQIVPATDSQSQALQAEYFKSKGLKVKCFELEGNYRTPQSILHYTNKLRHDIATNNRNTFYGIVDDRQNIFNLDQVSNGQLDSMKEVAKKVAVSKIGSSIVVVNSMKKAQEYNQLVRSFQRKQRLIEPGDVLMLAKNIYYGHQFEGLIPISTFIYIDSILGNPIVHSIKMHDKNIDLQYLPVQYSIVTASGVLGLRQGYILLNSLKTDEIDDTYLPLYIDYLSRNQARIEQIRCKNKKIESDQIHRQHDRRTNEYWVTVQENLTQKIGSLPIKATRDNLKELLRNYPECDPKRQCRRIDPYNQLLTRANEDPFYNCILARYGYAAVVYRVTGYEWNNVYIDFENQNSVKQPALRWAYTALSRSNKRLIVLNKSGIFADKFRVEKKIANDKKIRRLQKISKFNSVSFGALQGDKFLLKQLFGCLDQICHEVGIKRMGIDTQKIDNNFIRCYYQLKSGEIFELQMYFNRKGWSKANIYVRDEYQDEDLQQINQFSSRLAKLNPYSN